MRLTLAALTAVAATSLLAASASAQSHDHAAMGDGAHAQAAAVDHSAMIPRATPGQTGQAVIINGAGAHINHTDPKTPHGLLNAQGPDDGDLPNLFAAADGSAHGEFFTTKARISQDGPGQWLWDADGSALVIHANPDDHNSQPIGGAGDRVACAVLSAH